MESLRAMMVLPLQNWARHPASLNFCLWTIFWAVAMPCFSVCFLPRAFRSPLRQEQKDFQSGPHTAGKKPGCTVTIVRTIDRMGRTEKNNAIYALSQRGLFIASCSLVKAYGDFCGLWGKCRFVTFATNSVDSQEKARFFALRFLFFRDA